jgi:UDP-N-acetylglucosamine kinase
MTEEEARIEIGAQEFIKHNARLLLSTFAPESICHAASKPVSLFMAGSPGAGKTEVSQSFVRRFKDVPVRIDADDIRKMCEGYTGDNSHLFQKAANKGVNILYDYALGNNLNCILDGTFAYGNAVENIERSLKRNRTVEIWFIYQDPVLAWEFTKAREMKETRHVSKEIFIRGFKGARQNAALVKEKFAGLVELNVLSKDSNNGTEDVYLNVTGDELDRLTKGEYAIEELYTILI